MSLMETEHLAGKLEQEVQALGKRGNNDGLEIPEPKKRPQVPVKPASGKGEPAPNRRRERVLEYHPLADMFLMDSEKEMKPLAADIKAHGLREPIVLLQGKILDGRRRYFCCLKAGVKPVYRKYRGDDPASYVFSKNFHRRHLNANQKALVAYRLLPRLEEEARKRQLAGKGADGSGGRGNKKGENLVVQVPQGLAETPDGVAAQEPAQAVGRARDQAAELVGVSGNYIAWLKLIEKEAPHQMKAIEEGKKTIPQVVKKLYRNSGDSPAQEDNQAKGIPNAIRGAVQPLNGQKFQIVYTATEDLTGEDQIKEHIGALLKCVLADRAVFIVRSRLDERVLSKIGHTGLLIALVLETNRAEINESFNVEVKHELLRIYVPEDGGLIPPARIESLIKCHDPLELIESWFPTATKLRLAGDARRDGWTTISSLRHPSGEAATSLTIRPSAQADANGPN
jgi:hypothetical protein